MSKPLDITCPSGKPGFKSKVAAENTSRGLANKGQRHKRRMPVYQCTICHSWHMTSPSERGGGRLRRTREGPVLPTGRPLKVEDAFARLAELEKERTNDAHLRD